MPGISTIVQSQVNSDDSTASTVSEKVKADGYFGNADGLHTVAYICSSDFVGTIKMQGSLANQQTSLILMALQWVTAPVLCQLSMSTLQATLYGYDLLLQSLLAQ
jgi:hypothetical protein